MEIQLSDKITVQPVCLLQGESRATTLQFSLPRTHAGCRLDQLAWQVQCQNQSTLTLAVDTLAPKPAPEDSRFLLPWCIGPQFARHSGALATTLVGSAPSADEPGGTVAKFSLEGVQVAPAPPGDGPPPPEAGCFESALLQTAHSAALASHSAESAQTSLADAETAAARADEAAGAAQSAAGTAKKAGQTAESAAQLAQQAAESAQNSANGMDPALYDSAAARQDIFALIGGLPPVYRGAKLRFYAGAGRVQKLAVTGKTIRQGSGEAAPDNPRPLLPARSAHLAVNGQTVALPLQAPLYCAQNTRTGKRLQDVRSADGEEVHPLAVKTFSGTENFSIWGQQNATTEFATEPMDVFSLAAGGDMPTALCSHFAAPMTPNQLWSAAVPGFSASFRLLLRTQHKTVAQLQQWLAQQHAAGTPLQIVYQRTAVMRHQHPAALPPFAEGENTLQTLDDNAVATVQLKRVFEA